MATLYEVASVKGRSLWIHVGQRSVSLLGLSFLGLSACAQTNALIGNHQNAAYNYRAAAQGSEKDARKQADLQNHIVAAMKYIDAARSRLSSAQEYQKIGNPVWAKNMFDKSSADLTTAANEIKAAQSPLSN